MYSLNNPYDAFLDSGFEVVECTGYAFECECEDCTKARELYDEYDWLSDDKEFNGDRLREIEKELDDMGYCI